MYNSLDFCFLTIILNIVHCHICAFVAAETMSQKKPVKRKHLTGDEELRCVIHYSKLTTKDEHVIQLSDKSYQTLLEAKNMRGQLSPKDNHQEQCSSIPLPSFDHIHGYHQQCYNKFTKVKYAKKYQEDDTSEATDSATCTSSQVRTNVTATSTSGILFPSACGICKKDVIKIKGVKQYTTPIVTKIAEATMKKAAELHQDDDMLRRIQAEDLIAREFRKHENCYREYTRITHLKEDVDDSSSKHLCDDDTGKFEEVCNIIDDFILTQNQAISMSFLNETYGTGLGDRQYRFKLKDRLQNKYGDSLFFVTVVPNKPQVVISAKALRYHTTATELFHLDDKKVIKQAAVILRHEILEFVHQAPVLPWPPTVDSLLSAERQPPSSIISFYNNILKDPKKAERESTDQLSTSFSEDLIHGVTRGKFLTAKHALVGTVVHNMTGQKIPVNILSNLGNSASYDKVCEIETGLAELSHLFQEQGQMLPLQPSTESAEVLTVFWMDNFDHNVETLTGHGTIHNTHAVAYQEESDETIKCQDFIQIPRTKRRSIVPSLKEIAFRQVHSKKEPPIFNGMQKKTQF